MLAPIYTISGSPVVADDDPNITAPPTARKFYPPSLSVGPSQLWLYHKDGTGSFLANLWYHDPTNACWVLIAFTTVDQPKQLAYFKVDLGVTAELFVQIIYAGNNDITKAAYGFGIGSIGV